MRKITISEEDFYLSKVETLCYELRNAIIDVSLKYPELTTFERNLDKIQSEGNILYILGLLHRCYCLAHPIYLLEPMQKELTHEEKMSTCLCRFSKDEDKGVASEENCELVKLKEPSLSEKLKAVGVHKDELDKESKYLELVWELKKPEYKMVAYAFHDYLEQLHEIVSRVYGKQDFTIREQFVVSRSVQTNIPKDKLIKVFDLISSEKYKCCSPSEANKLTFLSIFDTAICESPEPIKWIEKGSKTGREASKASIYTIFSTLGVDMSVPKNRKAIREHITWNGEKLTPSQIKSRKNPKQEELIKDIQQVIK